MTKSIKTITMSIIMAFCFATTCLVLSGCGEKNNATFSNSTDAFGFAGATAGAFLNDLNSATSAQVYANEPNQVASMEQEQNVEILNKYIDIFDSVVGNNAIISQKQHLDDTNYNYKITTTVTDLNGEKQTFEMKFKEVKADNTLVTDDDKDEITSRLQGVMTYQGKEYTISGKKEVERDEIEIEFIAYIDQSNYVRVQQETESGEQEFTYTVYSNRVEVDSTSIEIEKERNELEVELQYSQNGKNATYKFERVGNTLRILYRDESGQGYIRASIDNNGNTITYTFDDGTTITKNAV